MLFKFIEREVGLEDLKLELVSVGRGWMGRRLLGFLIFKMEVGFFVGGFFLYIGVVGFGKFLKVGEGLGMVKK